MKIIDAHMHIFDYLKGYGRKGELRAIGNGWGRWANGDEMRIIPEGMGDVSFPPEKAVELMDRYGVERGVLLQGNLYGFMNEYVKEAVEKYPDRFVGACTIDPYFLEAKAILDRWVDKEGFDILKFEFSTGGGFMGFHGDFKLNAPLMDHVWYKAEQKRLVVALDYGSPYMESFQLEETLDILRNCPHIQLVVCHTFAPTKRPGDEEKLIMALDALKPFENVSFDLAALLWNTLPDVAPYPTAAHYMKLTRDRVGSERMMFGTDLPTALTAHSFEDMVNSIVQCGHFNEQELENIMYNTAKRVYFRGK
ncbi:MAG: amidohydrolase family protein [Eubacteriales bacterium]|jgi:predicted TIM-barrel fold metal-dependent hydrolase